MQESLLSAKIILKNKNSKCYFTYIEPILRFLGEEKNENLPLGSKNLGLFPVELETLLC